MAVTELKYRLIFCCKIPLFSQWLAKDKEVSTVVMISPHLLPASINIVLTYESMTCCSSNQACQLLIVVSIFKLNAKSTTEMPYCNRVLYFYSLHL